MSGFYMLAGTVLTNKPLFEVQQLLSAYTIDSSLMDDELELVGQATIAFRTGFDHELILVGDSAEKEILLAETRHLSRILTDSQLFHCIEIYGTQNQLICEFVYQD